MTVREAHTGWAQFHRDNHAKTKYTTYWMWNSEKGFAYILTDRIYPKEGHWLLKTTVSHKSYYNEEDYRNHHHQPRTFSSYNDSQWYYPFSWGRENWKGKGTPNTSTSRDRKLGFMLRIGRKTQ